jgi:hypothetical protein
MKTFFFIVLFSCCTNIDVPFSDLQQFLQSKFKKIEVNVQETPLNALQSNKTEEESNHTNESKQIKPASIKQADFLSDSLVNEEIKKIEGMRPFAEVPKEEQFVRSEIAIFYSDCVLGRLEYLENLLTTNQHHLRKNILQMKKNIDLIKLMLGIQIDDLKYIDKELVKEMIFDIESRENHL